MFLEWGDEDFRGFWANRRRHKDKNNMTGPWVWVCKSDQEIIYDVLTYPVSKKKRPLVRLALQGGVVAVNAFCWFKGWAIM